MLDGMKLQNSALKSQGLDIAFVWLVGEVEDTARKNIFDAYCYC